MEMCATNYMVWVWLSARRNCENSVRFTGPNECDGKFVIGTHRAIMIIYFISIAEFSH